MSALCYDLDPGEGGGAGQIALVDFENHACRVLAPSLRAWLEAAAAKLRAAQRASEGQA